MRATTINPGPIFPDDGPRGKRIIRRARGITAEVLALVLVTSLLPLLLVVAVAVDLTLWLRARKPWMAVRLVGFAWWFLLGDVLALVLVAYVWLRAGGRDRESRRRGVYNLRTWWARHHLDGASWLFGLSYDIDGAELAADSPYVVMLRHASIIDNLVGDSFVGHPNGVGMRYVIKRELEMIPAIDIAGRWVPTIFVKRASGDAAAETKKIATLADGLGEGEAVLIYPEGTRWTADKAARVREILAERQPEIVPLANRLEHTLPPRLGGPLALLERIAGTDTDVVFCGHVGFDGFQYISDIWAGGLVGRQIKLKFWRVPGSEIPSGADAQTRWLYEHWQHVDDWIGEQKSGR